MMTNVAQNEQQQKTTVKSVVRVWTGKNMQFSLKNIVSSNAPNAEIRWFFSDHTLEKALFATKVCVCVVAIFHTKNIW